MKRFINILAAVILGMMTVTAQVTERVEVRTDKDFYLSGEKMYLSVHGVDAQNHPLTFSKVVYVELLGDAYNAVRVKVGMEQGRGAATIDLPYTLSSGVYELVAYTRWMRNEGETAFFRKPVAVYNSLRYSATMDKIEFADSIAIGKQTEGTTSSSLVCAEKSVYHVREKVALRCQLPEGANVSVSVVRQDKQVPLMDKIAWQKREKSVGSKEQQLLLPELEGMIVESRFVSSVKDASVVRPNLSIKGRHMHYYTGQVKENGKVVFYTPLLEGVKEMVAGVEGNGRLEMVSPFVALPPGELQPLHLYKEQEAELMERCMQVQAARFYPTDTIRRNQPESIYQLSPFWSYDLDNYRRFKTFEETFLEFMPGVGTVTRGGRRYISISEEITGVPNHGNTLVFLDGVVVMDHELLLKYNPYFVKWVDIYVGQYVFGDQLYGGIITFRTPNHWMPNFQLPANSVVVEYEGVQPDEKYVSPNLENPAQPDFRHTLYWNPHVTDKEQQLECWTSDMCGTYIIKVEGWTDKGERVESTASFEVQD